MCCALPCIFVFVLCIILFVLSLEYPFSICVVHSI